MMKLISREMFNTSLGLKVIIDRIPNDIKTGDIVLIDSSMFKVKSIALSPKADDESVILTVQEVTKGDTL